MASNCIEYFKLIKPFLEILSCDLVYLNTEIRDLCLKIVNNYKDHP